MPSLSSSRLGRLEGAILDVRNRVNDFEKQAAVQLLKATISSWGVSVLSGNVWGSKGKWYYSDTRDVAFSLSLLLSPIISLDPDVWFNHIGRLAMRNR